MTNSPTPWTSRFDGHGGICVEDANGRQIGFLSNRPGQEDHAALLVAAPLLKEQNEQLRALVQGILDERDHCFIPNDRPGTSRWDERARKALNT